VILEANGDSYTDNNLTSAYTGIPTIQGWYVHEWLWIGSTREINQRVKEIKEIYTLLDIDQTRKLLKKHGIDYVIIGSMEKTKFSNLNENKFKQLGKLIFSESDLNIYGIELSN